MAVVAYYLFLPLIYLTSILPFPLLYVLSDLMYIIVYYLAGYRTNVVYRNLKNAFPDKTEDEIEQISKAFYKRFCDFGLETVKTITISRKALKKHIRFDDISLFRKYKEQNQSVIILMGHFGNFELAGARFSVEPIHKLYVIYHPLKNKQFDRLIHRTRTRLGTRLYKMSDTLRGMVRDRDLLTATAFIADQTPYPKTAYWMDFMGQDAPVFSGAEDLARKFNYPVIYVSVKRVKRGLYTIGAELISEKPREEKEHDITIRFTRRLEQDIREQPHNWWWTHKRWKHKKSGNSL